MQNIIFLLFLLFISACSSTRPSLLEKYNVGESETDIAVNIWPQQLEDIDFSFHGAISVSMIDLNLQGRIAKKTKEETLQVVILSQFGSSILQAEVQKDGYQIYSESVLLKKNPNIRAIILEAIQNMYFPETDNNCQPYAKDKELQINCPKTGNLYAFRKEANLAIWQLKENFPNSDNVVISYSQWQDNFPNTISYKTKGSLIEFHLKKP
ncbi:MAG: hypothetical protein OCC45_15895 [Desulfotalea sp.]